MKTLPEFPKDRPRDSIPLDLQSRACVLIAVRNCTGLADKEVYHAFSLTGMRVGLEGATDTELETALDTLHVSWKLVPIMEIVNLSTGRYLTIGQVSRKFTTGRYILSGHNDSNPHAAALIDGKVLDTDDGFRPRQIIQRMWEIHSG